MSTGLDQMIEKSQNGNLDLGSNVSENSSAGVEIEPPEELEESLQLLIERDNPMADIAEKTLDQL